MLGDRLKLARKRAGLSLDGLVEKIDHIVSKQAVSKYERNRMMPGSEVLLALCGALDVTPEFLLGEQVGSLEGVDFRKTVRTSAKDRARVEATVIDHMQRYLTVEAILELSDAQWRRPRLEHATLGNVEAAEALADELRSAWDLGDDPIPDMTQLLEDRGIKVLLLDLPGTVSGLTCFVMPSDGGDALPIIVINREKSLERRRFTLAHELAHRVIDVDDRLSEKQEEQAAQRFAGAFLMPADHLRHEVGEHRGRIGYQEFMYLKRMYRVSAAALAMRLAQIGVIEQSTLSTLFQTVGRTWRSEEPDPIEPQKKRGVFERPKRFERLALRALAEDFISPAKAVELMQIPLSELRKAMSGPNENHCQ